jgi:D-alanyl-D-alanine carboxypeptidase/D-alanyl-D-alanine-endopeptidase (penicillin-binding protein 4)
MADPLNELPTARKPHSLAAAAVLLAVALVVPGSASGQAMDPVSVTLTGDRTVRASWCARFEAEVTPPKPGTEVLLERRTGSGWTTLAEGTLDANSSASLRLCFGWDDLGTMTVRATWYKRDGTNASGSSAPLELRVGRAGWMQRIDRLAGGLSMGIAVREDGEVLYRRADRRRRPPASNEKLLLTMALLDALGPDQGIRTVAAARGPGDGVVGDVWILGHGDPGMGPARMGILARAIDRAGIRRVRGSVMGSTRYFARDWRAPGWKPYFPRTEMPLPTALVWRGNRAGGRHITDPERRAAEGLTRRLEALGIPVRRRPEMGSPPDGLQQVASVESPRLANLLETMDRSSLNFNAEVLGKRLGAERGGPPGTIAKGAAAIEAWAARHGVTVRAHDGSGLSYRNRVSPRGLVRLLGRAELEPWGPLLLDILPAGGEGTLGSRLEEVPVHAKTGTLTAISALSGYVWLERSEAWAQFSILSRGLSKDRAVAIENNVVRLLWRNAAAV